MSTWRPDFQPDHLYFVTTAAVRHWHLFRRDVTKRLVVDVLDCMRLRERFKLYCFTVMPNHVHLIIQCRLEDPLADCVRDFKKHVANRLIRHFQAEGNRAALVRLDSTVVEGARQRRRVWEDGYQAKDIFIPDFLRQKMTYVHGNPCQPHWNLVGSPEQYAWSTVRYYLADGPAIIPVDDARDLLI